MNMTRNRTIALLILALAGCASERSGEPSGTSGTTGDTPGGTSGYTPGSGSPGGSQSNQSSTTGTMTSGTGSGGMTGSGQSVQTSYGVVQAIDPMQRQDAGVGMAGAAAAGGGVGMPTDKVYRVTVRMDDGGNQMVVVDSMPSYKIGDRVRYSNGTLSSY